MAGSTATCAGSFYCDVIGGYLAVSPGTSITGNFVCDVMSTIDSDACATDGLAAWMTGRAMTGNPMLAEVGGEMFGPGVYVHESAINIALTNPVVTLDAGGDPDAVFIFNAGTTLTTSAGSEIVLLNEAKADNVFWVLGTALTMGADSILVGNVLTGTAITMGTKAKIMGRAIAQTTLTCETACAVELPSSQPSESTAPFCEGGLKKSAEQELKGQGLFKYLGVKPPEQDLIYADQLGFKRWSWDASLEDAPKCIAGTDFAVYFRQATDLTTPLQEVSSDKLVIFLQGGGACWGGSTSKYACNVFEQLQAPLLINSDIGGIFDFQNQANPIVDDGIVPNIIYVPYCDGSAWSGDNTVEKSVEWKDWYTQQVGRLVAVNAGLKTIGLPPLPGAPPDALPTDPGRNHLGIRNLSAAISAANQSMVGNVSPNTIYLIGHSAGGVGVSTAAMPMVRKAFGGDVELVVFNDAGPIAINTVETSDLHARADDWSLGKFYPPSCGSDCNVLGQLGLAFVDWYLKNDCTVRIAHFSFLNDPVNREYYRLEDDTIMNRVKYTGLLKKHLTLNCKYPNRYKNYIIRSPYPEGLHGAIQWSYFYQPIPFLPNLPDWTGAFFDNEDNVKNIFIVPGSICLCA
eukprot:CAMPEP_0202012462 /NCGR_PEP_ID=MMETSP0905-20130828/23443_1 /ASSEMBLY_ACC=CAM_ASM_000554 /TAXON_ID=420261 /ORGANISM="Thalassiosira antarctica, Strain CCMP982" /LENGTH=629 /DNA_ID=CAMNT_0048571725 /DNA_START=194 /DNA_END=2083 /DNA_ORIENTATION=-